MCLSQPVETRGEAFLQESTDCFRRHQTEATGILNSLQDQTGKDVATLQLTREDLSTQTTQALKTVHSFLQEELREDVPTGMSLTHLRIVLLRVCQINGGCHSFVYMFVCFSQAPPLSVRSTSSLACS